jgi:TRAP-type C4-dicarboxylate transport system permease small subunit
LRTERRWHHHVEDTVGVVLYAYIGIVMFVEVVSRYVFNRSSAWGEETAVYAFIWLTYLAATGPTRDRSHLSFDWLQARLPSGLRTAALLLSDACFLLLAVVMVYTSVPGVEDGIRNGLRMKGVDLPMALASLAVPLGWSLIALRIVQRAVRLIRHGPPGTAATLTG